jgi:competence protein ComGC
LLVVVAVLSILMGGYFARDGADTESSTYRRTMNKANDTACIANRATLRTQIEMFRMDNASLPVTTENLQAKGVQVPTCPQGGAYGWTKDNTVLCNKHLP